MSVYANGTNVPYPPDCADCPNPESCKAKNDCEVMRQIRHRHERPAITSSTQNCKGGILDKTPRTDALHAKWYGSAPLVPDHCESLNIPSVWGLARQLETELSAANAQLAEYKRDAGRYRWLRDEEESDWIADKLTLRLPEDWDAFIDKRRAAMDQTEGKI